MEQGLIILFSILYGGGIIAHLVPVLLEFTRHITDFLLLFTNLSVLFLLWKKDENWTLVGMVFLFAFITFLIEVTGVNTGVVFGNYEYGDTMKLQVFQVPLVIGINWVMLTLAGMDLSQKYFGKIYPPLMAALLVVGFDYIMEPVAIKLNYWHWFGAPVPFQNYAAWFVIALIVGSVFYKMKLVPSNKLLRAYLIIQFLFFLLLGWLL